MPLDLSQPDTANPLTVEVTRGGIVESRHRGVAAIVDTSGGVRAAWGDIKAPVFPRSAVKAFQALPMIESGAIDAAGFDGPEIAILGASHGGEPAHVDTVTGMLEKLGLGEPDLECGVDWPMFDRAARKLATDGIAPDQRHNNCSGKHAGMLALAKHLGASPKGYTRPDHPVQQRIMGVMEQMCGVDLGNTRPGIDGCSAPNWPIPIENLAYAFARFGVPDDLPESRRDACRRLADAVAEHPFMIAGTERFCTDFMAHFGRRLFVKTGAEGVFCAALPEYGIGLAVKCDDGARRGAETMTAALLKHIGLLEKEDEVALAGWLNPSIRNRRDIEVGEIRPAASWLSF